MKTLNTIQNATLTLIALFVLTSIIRVLVHIVQTHPFQLSNIISFGVLSLIVYVMCAILLGLWKESFRG